MKVNFILFITLLLFTSSCCVFGQQDRCAKIGRTCRFSYNNLLFNRPCCSGFCVDGICLPTEGGSGGLDINPRLPMLRERCDRKMRDVDCGDNDIEVLGPYCVCGCPKFQLSYVKFGESCVPTTAERQVVILLCREYKKIEDCPAHQALFANDRCQAIKKRQIEIVPRVAELVLVKKIFGQLIR